MPNLQVALPVELTNEITSYLSDKTSLSSCSLVCKGWRRGSQKKLLQNVYIDNSAHPLQSFLDFVSSADALRSQDGSGLPPVSKIIRGVQICGHTVLIVDLRAVLQALPRLETVALNRVILDGARFIPTDYTGDYSPITLHQLTIKDVITVDVYDELLQLFSLFRWIETLKIVRNNVHPSSPALLPGVVDSEPTLQPSYPSFPRTFEGFRRIGLYEVWNLPYLLQLLAKVLRRRREREGTDEREMTHVYVGELNHPLALLNPELEWVASFAPFAREFCGAARVVSAHVPQDLGEIRSLNLPAFRSLTAITLKARFSWTRLASAINSQTFLAITSLIGECPRSLHTISLQLLLRGYRNTDLQRIHPLLRAMDIEYSWLRALPTVQPRLTELRWSWVMQEGEGVDERDLERVREEWNDIVREKLLVFEERGLLRFGLDGDGADWEAS